MIEIIVCTKVGGGYDADARLLAPFLQEQLPGSTVIVRNVPGGGHIVGANRVWNAPPNGLTLGVANVPGLIALADQGRKGDSVRSQKIHMGRSPLFTPPFPGRKKECWVRHRGRTSQE